MKNNKKINSCLGYAAWVGDYAIAAIAAPWVAGRRVREDIMDVKNLTKWVPVLDTYKKHLVEHVKNHNNDRMTVRALRRCRVDTKKFDPFYEIDQKQIGYIIDKLKNTPYIMIQYFEETEHQPRAPQMCKFGDYIINFASSGTEWCGGMRGNGYISAIDVYGKQIKPIAKISPELSDYLAKTIMQKTR